MNLKIAAPRKRRTLYMYFTKYLKFF